MNAPCSGEICIIWKSLKRARVSAMSQLLDVVGWSPVVDDVLGDRGAEEEGLRVVGHPVTLLAYGHERPRQWRSTASSRAIRRSTPRTSGRPARFWSSSGSWRRS